MKKRLIPLMLVVIMFLTGCDTASMPESKGSEPPTASEKVVEKMGPIGADKWLYNEEDDVYYQLQLLYCEKPADASLEKLAIFVPGAYFTGTPNGDGTYTCKINEEGTVGSYTAKEAPFSFAVYTPGYAECAPVSGYIDFTTFTDAGIIHVYSGCRGRNAGAPAGVTDLKAAIRYLRSNAVSLPGNTDQIYAFGMSGGGAQCAILAASGNSADYEPYLDEIGAVKDWGDEVMGAMCWCPVTNLDTVNEAYEWEMGVSRTDMSAEDQMLSDRMAKAYAEYVNQAGFIDESGLVLTLEASDTGAYQAGTYYDYIKATIEDSLNSFLAITEFPYDADLINKIGQESGRHKGTTAKAVIENPTTAENWVPLVNAGEKKTDIFAGVYETAQDYIDALNTNGIWVLYDDATNTVSITSVSDFVCAAKPAGKSVGAFDSPTGDSDRNEIFGIGSRVAVHFDAIFGELLADTEYSAEFEKDFSSRDSVGNTVLDVVKMYTPLNYLMESYDGYGTATVAKYWRIRSGISQEDRPVSSEINLILALQNCDAVEALDYATIWGQKHVQAEFGGAESVAEYIKWVEACMHEQAGND